ncbi:hypothetical protein POV27_16800 [Aureisphaera galaxeae]|uniref:hypothetical protein n=1 Tax=Aureisphaera galaxeae TaxID=1538023 RepID=UPI0023502604|nr:hypothetical protein [Aureisphaera galaxeae]MDC8005720.1 hypothetical protein [Aureisphaera galaxeae]
MRSTYYKILSFVVCLLLASTSIEAQIGINTNSPDASSALEVHATDKGFLMPRISLSGTNDLSTINPISAGIMVYNMNTATGPNSINPGFYYYDGSRWRRLYNEGYNLNYVQTAQVRASTSYTTSVDLPGLDTGSITVPFTGTYQIVAKGYMTAGDRLGGASGDGATQGSIRLVQSTSGGSFTSIKETYITSSSKDIDGTNFYNLGQAAFIVLNVDLVAGTTYRFKVQGREWRANGVDTGWFGRDTSGYSGASGVNTAQRGFMSLSLVEQH